MATKAVQFYLPPGRLVMGSTHELQTKDQQGRPREKPQIFFGVAVPKNSPGVQEVLGIINQVARNHYGNHPQIAPQIAQGLNAVNFAWKVEDGDSEKNKTREGFAGCWVFRFSTSIFPIRAGDSQHNPIDPATIKTGYYVDVTGSVAPNELTDKNAGVFLNPNGVRLLGFGKEIISGPTIGQLFADKPPVLPAGASAMPVADAPALGGPAPMAPAGGLGAPMAPTGGLGAPAPAGPGFATQAAPPPPPPVSAPVPPAPPAPTQTPEQVSAQLAAAAGVQHYPGFRIKPDRSGYEPDPTTVVPTATPPAPMSTTSMSAGTGLVAAASLPSDPMSAGVAGGQGVPAGASPGPALGIAPNGSTTAFPSNVQPHPGFLNPPAPTQSPDEISAGIAAANGVQHYPGYRFDVATRQYLPNPTA